MVVVSDSVILAVQVVALVTEGAQRPELPAPKDLPGSGTFAGYSEYIMLMEQCWHQDAAARPTFAQVHIPGLNTAAADVLQLFACSSIHACVDACGFAFWVPAALGNAFRLQREMTEGECNLELSQHLSSTTHCVLL